MSEITVNYPTPHAAQRTVIQQARRFNVLNCGRRWGKDILLTRRNTKIAVKGAATAWFAPTYRMLSDNWRMVNNILYPVISKKNEQEKRIDFISGGSMDFWSLDNIDAARGRKYKHVTVNEAAMIRDLRDAWTMVIRPTLVDMNGGADFGSTPRGLNYFYELYSTAADKQDWARWTFPTSTNPYIPQAEIETMRADLPERVYRQEILAEFIEDGAYFQNVDAAAIIEKPDQPGDHAGHRFVMGVDWALSEDYTVITIGCRECARVVDWERFNRIDFTYQRERLYTMAARWHIDGALPERNSIGEPNIEIIRNKVVVLDGPDGRPGFNTTASTKPPLIQALAAAIEHEGFKVPHAAADELRAYEVETMASGHPKFSAPSGLHDDWVMSLALLWRAMTTGGVTVTENPFYD